MERPTIIWKGAHPTNFDRGRGAVAPEAIVLHIAEGNMAGIDAWFNDPRARASTHFAVGTDGAVHQYVDLNDTPFANGAVEPGYTARLIDANPGISPNRLTVSVEHEGRSGDAVTPAQFEASTRLAAWLFATVLLPGAASGVALDRDHVLRHADISPRSRPRCPGWSEPFITRYIDRVRAWLSAPPQPPVPPRIRHLENALTLQATALDDLATRATIQAANLRAVLRGP